LRSRKLDNDYLPRIRKSLRAGWFIFFIFYPKAEAVKYFLYSFFMQWKKVFKQDRRILIPLLKSIGDLFRFSNQILRARKPLSAVQYKNYKNILNTKIYWKPN